MWKMASEANKKGHPPFILPFLGEKVDWYSFTRSFPKRQVPTGVNHIDGQIKSRAVMQSSLGQVEDELL